MPRTFVRTSTLLLVLALAAAGPALAQCEPQWAYGLFPLQGINGVVYASCLYDDGSGPALYVAGSFSVAGNAIANNIARWNGTSWSALGSGLDPYKLGPAAMCVYNGDLYVGGTFAAAGVVSANNIARWDGTSWHAVGSGIGGGSASYIVRSLCVHDGELYVGGQFSSAGDVSAAYIARWDGTSWQSLGAGLLGQANALCVYDDHRSPSPALYAGGDFQIAGGSTSAGIARWGCETAFEGMAAAKQKPDATLVNLQGGISTAALRDAFYVSSVQNGQQVSGIRVEMPEHGVGVDEAVSVLGRTATSASGERYIAAWQAISADASPVDPLAMVVRNLGGGPAGAQVGITDAAGLNNIGMLVRVCGTVTRIDDHSFMLNDGSGATVRCIVPSGITVDPLWQYVAVSGISTCERSDIEVRRRLLVRSVEDLQVILP